MNRKTILCTQLLFAGLTAAPALERISINDLIGPGDGNSQHISVSADGNRIAFESFSSQLVADDTNGERDIFVFDRTDGSITRVSVGPMGVEANDASRAPVISGDGRFVAFTSDATNLLAVPDSNGIRDLFIHDLDTGTTTIESVADGGATVSDAGAIFYECALSFDGNLIAFSHPSAFLDGPDSNGESDIFLRDRTANTTVMLSKNEAGTAPAANGGNGPSISGDGRIVAFNSNSSDIVAMDGNGVTDVFIVDRQGGTTTRVGEAAAGGDPDGLSNGVVSRDGRFVYFESLARNLIPGDTGMDRNLFRQTVSTGAVTRLVGKAAEDNSGGGFFFAGASNDARWVYFASTVDDLVPDDTNGKRDFFRFDTKKNIMTRLSVSPEGNQTVQDVGDAIFGREVSANGVIAGFTSLDGNLAPPDLAGNVDVLIDENVVPAVESALRRSLNRKLKKLKKKRKKAKRKKRKAKAKRYKRKIRSLKRRIRLI